jgi:hypothetical protein
MSTATSVGVQTETRVRTAVHLTDAIMGTFSHILAHLGLRSAYLNEHWTTIEVGLKTWIAEGSLEAVRLECGARARPDAVFEIPISYKITGSGDITFVTSQTRITRSLAKLQSVPSGSSYRVVVEHTGAHTQIDGWKPTSLADISGMSSYSLGGVASGPDASARLTALSRSGS